MYMYVHDKYVYVCWRIAWCVCVCDCVTVWLCDCVCVCVTAGAGDGRSIEEREPGHSGGPSSDQSSQRQQPAQIPGWRCHSL